MSLLAILTGLYRLNSLLPPSRPHCVVHHHYTTALKSSSLLQHPLLQFNPWLKWCLSANCCWSARRQTIFLLFMNTQPWLLLPSSLIDFQRSCQSFYSLDLEQLPIYQTGWRGVSIPLSFLPVISQFSSSKNSAFNINIYQFVFKRTVNPSLPHSTGWYFYNVCINMWFQWDDFTLLFLLC